MTLILSIATGADTRAFPLEADAVRIGRASQNVIQIADPTVSKEHAEILRANGRFTIRDLGSRNGTRVNGIEVREPTPIRDGDLIEIGKVQARVVTDAGEAKTTFDPIAGGRSSSVNLKARDIIARGETTLGDAARVIRLIGEAGRILVLPRPLRETCDDILHIVEQAVPATRLVILMKKGNSAELEQVAARLRGGSSRQPLAISRSILDRVLTDCTSVIVGDAAADPDFREQKSIVAQSIHSAMAVPLFDNEKVLGVLYADSVDPLVAFRREQLELLTLLANMAAVKITNARLLEAEQRNQRIAQELAYAIRIQRGLLPEPPSLPGWTIDARLETCHEVGGDLYDFHVREDGALVFLLGDVTGKGMGAALLMSSAMSSARTLYDWCDDPVELIRRLNAVMFRSTDPGRFVTMFAGVLDPKTGRLHYVNAGHNPPALLKANGVERLEAGGIPVGVLEQSHYDAGTTTLDSGDLLALFTDGIPEAEQGEDMYGDERLLELLQAGCHEPTLDKLGRRVMESVDAFCPGGKRSDDITLLLMRRG